jgi:hypothetical protein
VSPARGAGSIGRRLDRVRAAPLTGGEAGPRRRASTPPVFLSVFTYAPAENEADTVTALADLCRSTAQDLDELVDRTSELLYAEIPSYRRGEVIAREHWEATRESLEGVLAQLGGWSSAPRAPRVMTTLRVEQGFPLPELLRALQLSGAVLWESLAAHAKSDSASRDALLEATPRVWALLDAYAQEITQAHHEFALRNARRSEQVRASLLDAVLHGDPALGSFWEAVAALGIPRTGRFVVAQVDVDAADSPPDVEGGIRALRGVEGAWFRIGPRVQIGLVQLHARADRGHGSDRGHGHGHDREFDASPMAGLLFHFGATAGLSAPFPAVADTPRACGEAHVAAAAATPDRRLVRYDGDPLAVMVASAPEAAAATMAATLGPVLGLPAERGDPILATVRRWLSTGQSVAATARLMHCHRNTVNYRLRRFEELTGRRLAENMWLAQVVLALEAYDQVR